MEKIRSYIDLEVWKKCRVLTKEVYTITNTFPKEELYGLTSQLRRCAVSVPSNIAEGSGRQTAKDTIQFLHIARGSLFELETQFYIAFDLEYINLNQLDKQLEMISDCKKLLHGFINYYKNLSPRSSNN